MACAALVVSAAAVLGVKAYNYYSMPELMRANLEALTSEEIKVASELCVKAGADFVKTSTGFVKDGVGAKVEDVKLMFETVKNAGLGVKASGGVRDKETALMMIEAGATRIGTSSGVKIVSV